MLPTPNGTGVSVPALQVRATRRQAPVGRLRRGARGGDAGLEQRPGGGQLNRLKTIKRQMYGRAGLNLLERRFLLAA
jgi:hypothetical protein